MSGGRFRTEDDPPDQRDKDASFGTFQLKIPHPRRGSTPLHHHHRRARRERSGAGERRTNENGERRHCLENCQSGVPGGLVLGGGGGRWRRPRKPGKSLPQVAIEAAAATAAEHNSVGSDVRVKRCHPCSVRGRGERSYRGRRGRENYIKTNIFCQGVK